MAKHPITCQSMQADTFISRMVGLRVAHRCHAYNDTLNFNVITYHCSIPFSQPFGNMVGHMYRCSCVDLEIIKRASDVPAEI